MEKDFYTDDFEQLLKDTTEDFRMYPSRKVWHSIYNDLHPAKKWPSFAVCLLLITTILYVGIDNNNAINADADNIVLSTLAPAERKAATIETAGNSSKARTANTSGAAPAPVTNDAYSPPNTNSVDEFVMSRSMQFPIVAYNEKRPAAIAPATLIALPYQDVVAQNAAALNEQEILIVTNDDRNDLTQDGGKPTAAAVVNDSKIAANEPNGTPDAAVPENNEGDAVSAVADAKKINANPSSNTTVTDEKAWVDNYAFHNVRNGNKWKTKLSTLVYITPSVGYRVINRNNTFEPVNALLIRSSATTVDADDAITQHAAMNLESGATAILDLSRKLRVKAGVQFNYTNYVSSAQRLSHPIQTNILLNDLTSGNTVLVPVSSSFGNKGSKNTMRLNNNTIQFALPIGADYKIAGNDKFKWYIGATIQPTYVAGGNAYLVSSDYKNYVDMPSMLRTWNLNAGFESFVSYKTKGGSVINLGPQFRYQLLSTYSSRYTYSENLYNVGVKVGITRKF